MDIVYTSKGTEVRNVYRDGNRLVVRRDAVFPDICVGCGRPAWGNTEHQDFSGLSGWFLLPPPFDMLAHSSFGRRFHFDFPFCASCAPARLQLRQVRLDTRLCIFVPQKDALPSAFLDSLPSVPPDIAEEVNRSWAKRTFRWLYH